MSMDEPDTSSGRRPRAGESGAPVGSILSVILAVVAVAVGLFILREIQDDGAGGITAPDPGPSTPSNSSDPSGSTLPGGVPLHPDQSTPPADPINVRKGATVVVANANTTGGSAGQMSAQLREAGFTLATPVDAVGEEKQLDTSKVYFERGNADAEAVARTAARLLGGVEVARMPRRVPVQGGEIDGEVLVMLGVSESGKDLGDLGG